MAVAGFNLLGKTGSLLHKALDAESLRFQVRSHNLANVNTPAYKRQDVEFEAYLAAELDRKEAVELRRTHPRHLGGHKNSTAPRIVCGLCTTCL